MGSEWEEGGLGVGVGGWRVGRWGGIVCEKILFYYQTLVNFFLLILIPNVKSPTDKTPL